VTRRRTVLLAVVLAASLFAAGLPADGRPVRPRYFKTVKVGDNFYLPARLTLKPYTKITWRWPEDVGDTHDVKFRRTPRGVPKYQSEPAAAGYRYAKTLVKLGTYRIVCTFHEGEMVQTVVVRR
jgi:plastocyanin